jgi:acyl-CoA reductase-like NAD-dependent aldehyde dehydrogenase
MDAQQCVNHPSIATALFFRFTSHTAFLLCSVLKEAGLPAGVVNMVFGSGLGAGEPLVSHKDVDLVSFTGGSATGAKIAQVLQSLLKIIDMRTSFQKSQSGIGRKELQYCI